jgi:hypothetical protein
MAAYPGKNFPVSVLCQPSTRSTKTRNRRALIPPSFEYSLSRARSSFLPRALDSWIEFVFLHDSTGKMLPVRLQPASGFATSNIVEIQSFGHGSGRLQAPPGRSFGGLNLRADARDFGVNWLILGRAVDVLTHHDHQRSESEPTPCHHASRIPPRWVSWPPIR